MILVTSNFAVLILDTSIVDTVSNLFKAWKQSFGLGDGNLIASLGGSNSSIFPFFFRSSFGTAGLIDPSFRLNFTVGAVKVFNYFSSLRMKVFVLATNYRLLTPLKEVFQKVHFHNRSPSGCCSFFPLKVVL